MIIKEPDKSIINIPNRVTLMIDEQNGLYKFIEQSNRSIIYDNETPSIIYSSSNSFFEKRDFEIQKIGSLHEIIPYQANGTFIKK